MIEHAFQAIQTNKPIFGVKGPTSLHLIPNFDVARGMVPDIMHCLFLGIDNQFMKLWKTTRTGCYYVVNFCKKIDAVLSSISPPDDAPRIVRSYEKHGSDWKETKIRHLCCLFQVLR